MIDKEALRALGWSSELIDEVVSIAGLISKETVTTVEASDRVRELSSRITSASEVILSHPQSTGSSNLLIGINRKQSV